MPPKRSKSKERERKRKYRELMSDEKREIEKEKLKERMRKHRGKKSGGEKKETLTSALWAPGLLYGDTELYERNNEKAKIVMREKRLKQAVAELCQTQVKLEVMVGDLKEVGVAV